MVVGLINDYKDNATPAQRALLKPEFDGLVNAWSETVAGAGSREALLNALTAYISAYDDTLSSNTADSLVAKLKGVVTEYGKDPDAATTNAEPYLTALIDGWDDITDDEQKAALRPEFDALVKAWTETEAGTGSKEALLAALTAYITKYDDSRAEKPTVTVDGVEVAITPILSMDEAVLAAEIRKRLSISDPLPVPVRFGEFAGGAAALKANAVKLVGPEGLPIRLKPGVKPEDAVKTSSLVLGYDDDGKTLVISVEAQYAGIPLDFERGEISPEPKHTGMFEWLPETEDRLNAMIGLMQTLRELGSSGDIQPLSDATWTLTKSDMNDIASFIDDSVRKLESGELGADDAAALENKLASLKLLAETLDANGIGQHISAGIAQGLGEYGWETSAATLAGDLDTALRAATQVRSPSQMTVPIGQGISEGIGEGMGQFSLSPAAALVATNLSASLRAVLNADNMRPIGLNAMSGLALGILSGKAGVVSAIQQVAQAAVSAAKAKLKIESPSKVFRDEIGVMMTRGMGQGALLEAKNQRKIIRNAARYLTASARDGVYAGITADNRKSYSTTNQATVNVDKLVVQDKQDVRALAVEIGVVQRRAVLGMGG